MMMWVKLELASGGSLLVNLQHVTNVSSYKGRNYIGVKGNNDSFEIKDDVDKLWTTISETMKILNQSIILDDAPVQGSA